MLPNVSNQAPEGSPDLATLTGPAGAQFTPQLRQANFLYSAALELQGCSDAEQTKPVKQ